jgi:hypothetical protein
MPKYFVSKYLDPKSGLIYIQFDDSWNAVRPDGETSKGPGELSADVMAKVREIDAQEAGALIAQRHAKVSPYVGSDRQYAPAPQIGHNSAFTAIGGSGWHIRPGDGCDVTLRGSKLMITGPAVWTKSIEVPLWALTVVDISGPGTETTNAGIIGGGFGLTGAAIGMLTAGAINAMTTRSKTNTFLRIGTRDAEVFLHTSLFEPFDLRIKMSAACVAAENCDRRGLAAQLGDLYALHLSGALDVDEYARAKAAVLPGTPPGQGALPVDCEVNHPS